MAEGKPSVSIWNISYAFASSPRSISGIGYTRGRHPLLELELVFVPVVGSRSITVIDSIRERALIKSRSFTQTSSFLPVVPGCRPRLSTTLVSRKRKTKPQVLISYHVVMVWRLGGAKAQRGAQGGHPGAPRAA